jgi:LemA protein
MMTMWITIGVILFLTAAIVVGIFNRLVVLRQRTKEGWSQIDVQLKKRADMLPNLVETVKGYAAHEKQTLENVIKARGMLQSAGSDVGKTAEANNMLTGALKSLFAVVENYPTLKADQNFLMLQQEIAGIEDKIGYARQFYNQSVLEYNQYQQMFPGVIFAGMFGHSASSYFEADEADKKPVQVKF